MTTTTASTTFLHETVGFLRDLRDHNASDWFDANRARYEVELLDPARRLVVALGPKLERLVPGIHAEPKIGGSIFRAQRDRRFNPDHPYKEYLDLWFWEGERATAPSGLYVRVAPSSIVVGAGARQLFTATQRAAYRTAVASDAGPELVSIVRRLARAGFVIDGSRSPLDLCGAEPLVLLERQRALFARAELDSALAGDARLIPELLRCWRRALPLHRWLMTHR